ncbi:hypothetical protein AYR66_16085 [Noviherbaspirillum denitrificans]|uniref:Uncharacterized protein n=1 Tax=Noviherbaspirillum denitrificans TaxID=1968433 RepID=A0A254TDN2_9BURK|nr:hypothetical protein AYR66_16085 [Noviherbaspirillum denitrificans]
MSASAVTFEKPGIPFLRGEDGVMPGADMYEWSCVLPECIEITTVLQVVFIAFGTVQMLLLSGSKK